MSDQTNYNKNKIERLQALKMLKKCKEIEAQQIASGATYVRIDNKTVALRKK